jgi:hypothetical protein
MVMLDFDVQCAKGNSLLGLMHLDLSLDAVSV